MKFTDLLLGLTLLFSGGNIFGQTNDVDILKALFPSMPDELRNSIVVLVSPLGEPQPCPMEYTNLLSNTNLFSPAEEKLIREASFKYKNVTTNSGPAGTVFKEWGIREMKWKNKSNGTFLVACFTYTNSSDREEIAEFYDSHEIIAHFRTPAEDGYDALIMRGRTGGGALLELQEYKKGVLDGLCVFPNNPAGIYESYDKCYVYLRIAKGMAAGKTISWDEHGEIIGEMEYTKPIDVLKYSASKFDFSWTEVSTNSNPIPKGLGP